MSAAPGRLVGSGAFKVDRRRALDKLVKFQLPDPHDAALAFARCAVASGTKSIQVTTSAMRDGRSAFRMRFGGKPILPEFLDDPYASLLGEWSDGNVRERHLAIGLLSALRLRPWRIIVETDLSAGGRGRLSIDTVERDSLARVGGSGEKAFTEVLLEDVPDRARLAQALRGGCAACPVPIVVDGEELPRLLVSDDRLSEGFQEGALRAVLRVPEGPGPGRGLQAAAWGMQAGRLDLDWSPAVEGWVNDDRFVLNASQNEVARNERCAQTAGKAAALADRLLDKVIGLQPQMAAELSRVARDKDLARQWSSFLERGEPASWGLWEGIRDTVRLVAIGRGWRSERDAPALREAARSTRWLRAACAQRLGKLDKDFRAPDASLRALWEAPLLIDTAGRPLSLGDLEKQRVRLGHVPVSEHAAPSREYDFRVAWIASEADRTFLQRFFAGFFVDTAGIPGGAWKDLDLGGDVESFLQRERRGKPLVKDRFFTGKVWGEVALVEIPPASGARVYFQSAARAEEVEVPYPLRFVARVDGAGEDRAVAIAAACERAAGLYRKLADRFGEFRQPQVRAYLLEFLGWRLDQAEKEIEPWLERLALFQTSAGDLDLGAFRESADVTRAFIVTTFADSLKPGGKLPVLLWRHSDELLSKSVGPVRFYAHSDETKDRLAVVLGAESACAHRSRSGCLLEPFPGAHVALGPAEGGTALDLPWGRVLVFFPGDPKLLSDRLAAPEIGSRMLFEVLLKLGGMMGEGEEGRAFLLDALGALVAPWGKCSFPALEALLEHVPVFEGNEGTVWTLPELVRRFESGKTVLFADREGETRGVEAPLLIGFHEQRTLLKLWPLCDKFFIRPAAAKDGAAPRTKRGRPIKSAPARPPKPDRPANPVEEAVKILGGFPGFAPAPGELATAALGPLLSDGLSGISTGMVQAIVASGIDQGRSAIYLASLIASAANRRRGDVTDAEDIRIHQELARAAAGRGAREP